VRGGSREFQPSEQPSPTIHLASNAPVHRVTFAVHGSTEEEITRSAGAVLASFGSASSWRIYEIRSEPLSTGTTGRIELWQATVDAVKITDAEEGF